MGFFKPSMFTGNVIGTPTGSIANCPICGGIYRFETRREPETWRCHACTKGQWEGVAAFEALSQNKPTTGAGKSTQTVQTPGQLDVNSAEPLGTRPGEASDNIPDSEIAGYVTVDEKVGPAIEILEQRDVWYLDIETYSHELPRNGKDKPATDPFRNKIRLITLGDGQHTFAFDVMAISDTLPIVRAISRRYIVGHNLKFDLKTIAYKFGKEYLPLEVFDTMLMVALLYHASTSEPVKRGTLGLKAVLERYLELSVSKEEQASDWGVSTLRTEQIEYALADVGHLPSLSVRLVHELNGLNTNPLERVAPDKLGLTNKVARIENDFLTPSIRAELNGIPINNAIFRETPRLSQDVQEMEARFIEKYNLKPTQVQKIRAMLNEELDLDLKDMKKTTLAKFRDLVPVGEILDYRKAVPELRFLERFEGLLRDGKLYTSFKQIAASSGRMSTQPSVQCIPRGLKKTVYLPPEGWKLIRVDFPAIELRLAAVKSGEPNLIEAFRQGKDPHRITASKLSGKPEESIADDDPERKTAKACNFGLLYGMGAEKFRLYSGPIIGSYLTIEDAEKFRKQFFLTYPTLRMWQNKTGNNLKRYGGKGIVSTIYGRKVKVNKFTLALNVPVQGSGADLIKDAVVRFDRAITATGLSAQIVNIIHDEIVAIAPDAEAAQVASLLKTAMETAADDMIGLFHTPVKPEIFGRDGRKE